MLALKGNWEAFVHTWTFNKIEGANHYPPATERQASWPAGLRVLSPQICPLKIYIWPLASPCLVGEPGANCEGFVYLRGSHLGAILHLSPTPRGQLAMSGDTLVVPTGI